MHLLSTVQTKLKLFAKLFCVSVIQIKILNYPSIIVSDEFPSTARYVAVGESETKFTCSASYATSNTRDLYHNGVAVPGG